MSFCLSLSAKSLNLSSLSDLRHFSGSSRAADRHNGATCQPKTVRMTCPVLRSSDVDKPKIRYHRSCDTSRRSGRQVRTNASQEGELVSVSEGAASNGDAEIEYSESQQPVSQKQGERFIVDENVPAKIVDLLYVFGNLLDRPFGDGQSTAAAGKVVIGKATELANSLSSDESVDEQIVFELLRALQLLSMDMQLVGASKKLSTLLERLQQAKDKCMLAMKLASNLKKK